MAADDNSYAFVKLLTQHEPRIRSCVMLFVPNWNDAQDVTQEVCVILWRKFDEFQPGTSFVAWALTVARLVVKDYWKRQSRERRLFRDGMDEFVNVVFDDVVSRAEELDQRRSLLKRCMDEMKPAHRELLAMRYQEGAGIEEISARVGRSVDAIYKSVSRLREALVACVDRQIAQLDHR